MISYVLPSFDRPETLARTLSALGQLDRSPDATGPARAEASEVIVIDNASTPALDLPAHLSNGVPVRGLRRECSNSAAARNAGVDVAGGEWIVMLDDDSYPLHDGHIDMLRDAPSDVAAIGAEIFLSNGAREAGGLPEVFVGCGVAMRRAAFLEAGGYDEAFDYYVEEYDLCARLLAGGWRIIHDRRFQVMHHKVTRGRDMNRILHRLVRNSAWVVQRYAPEQQRRTSIDNVRTRYRAIAEREDAVRGYERGLAELEHSLGDQPRRELSASQYDRFTGFAHARDTLGGHPALAGGVRVAIIEPGKQVREIRRALQRCAVEPVDEPGVADVLVVGTMSPGPMVDALEAWADADRPVVTPWRFEAARSCPCAS